MTLYTLEETQDRLRKFLRATVSTAAVAATGGNAGTGRGRASSVASLMESEADISMVSSVNSRGRRRSGTDDSTEPLQVLWVET